MLFKYQSQTQHIQPLHATTMGHTQEEHADSKNPGCTKAGDHRHAVLEPTGAVLEPTCGVLEPAGAVLEQTNAALEPTSAVLEPAGVVLEPASAPLALTGLF